MRRTAPLLIAVFAPSVAHAATCTATTSALLATCLANANDGDVIQLTNGGTFELAAGFVVEDDVTLRPVTLGGTKPLVQSKDAASDGSGRHSLFIGTATTTAKVTLIELKLDNEEDNDSRSELFIEDGSEVIGDKLEFLTYTQGTAPAIDVQPGSKLSLTDSTFFAMTSTGLGAAIRAATNTRVSLTRVTATLGGSTTNHGGFLYAGAGATLSFVDSTFEKWFGDDGGAVYATAPVSVTISGSTFKDCDADDDGGAIAIFDGNLTIATTKVDSNHADGDGGAIYIERGALDADKLTSTGNDAGGNGGSIILRGGAVVRTATIDDSSFATDNADYGGGVYLEAANLTLGTTTFLSTKAKLDDNSSDPVIHGHGGAIYARASDVAVTGSTFTTTEAKGHGGAIYGTVDTVAGSPVDSDITVTASKFDTTKAEDSGGAIFQNRGDVVVSGSTFVETHANDDGGAIYVDNALLDVDTTTFEAATAGRDGGAIFVRNTPASALFDGGLFDACMAADDGGAIASDNGDLVMTNVDLTGNAASDNGGAIYLTGASTLQTTAGDFVSNKATTNGGAIYGYYNTVITVDGGTMDTNVGDNGGAIRAYGATATIRNGTSFTGNRASSGDGGAVAISVFTDTTTGASDQAHAFTITDASFTTNSASSDGGALAMTGWGTLDIKRSDFVNNLAIANGGALWLMPDDDGISAGAYVVTKSIFTGNDSGAGGALYADASLTNQDSFTFTDNAISANTAGAGGGIWVDQTHYANIGRNVFCDNWADNGNGGGVYVGTTINTNTGTRTLSNNFFVENKAKNKGGALHLGDADLPVVNNLFLTNASETTTEAGGIWLEPDGAVIRNNLILGTVKGDGLRIAGSTTTEENNGFASNTANHRTVAGVAIVPIAPSFVFTSAPSFFSYVPGTPADALGCAATDYRWYVSPGLSPAATTKDTGATGFTDLDLSANDIGPFGGPNANPAWWVDADKDGSPWVYDCNDADMTVFPGATELCNGFDDDCDRTKDEGAVASPWYADVDNDGYGDTSTGLATCTPAAGLVSKGGDCDDLIGTINPGAVEKCSTVGVDDDCNGAKDEATAADAGTWYADTDVDGYGNALAASKACIQPANATALSKATDCDDKVFTTNPGAAEVCNTVDDDCDKQVDESATDAKSWYPDGDKDNHGDATAPITKSCAAPGGYVSSNDDCNDKVATTYLGATEICNDVDDDCDTLVDDALTTYSWFVDGDLDSYGFGIATVDCAAPGAGWTKQSGDCNDALAVVNPGVLDNTCNSVDDNCSGKVDEGAVFKDWYEDKDADKYGTTVTLNACAQPIGYASGNGDCNDAVTTIHPFAVETCNLVDDDCNGLVDDKVVTYTFYQDTDGDGYGGTTTKDDCKAPAGYVIAGNDCNDASKAINPGAAELCNDTVDQNCDKDQNAGAIDALPWYADTDKDGQGDPSAVVMSCDPVTDRVATGKDCDDKNVAILDGVNWYGDGDGDKYGNVNDLAYQCVAPSGYLADATDCNDGNASINPIAAERCATPGIDDDCDKLTDDQDPQGVADGTTYYLDGDNDTYGAKDALTLQNGTRSACLRPPGYAVNALDCDDTTPLTRPGASEQCDSEDNNCNGVIDENVSFNPYWADADGDGFGDADASTVVDCKAPSGYIDNDTDCDDAKSGVNPNAPEQCATPGVDDDCDGQFDESDAIDQTAFYLDEDGDNWSILADEVIACDQPPNHATQLGDCDDIHIEVNPEAVEICDGIDNDCDDRVDEDLGALTVYDDVDGDGFGDDGTAKVVCRPPLTTESDVGGDCDDRDPAINPDAVEEWYNGVDQDCKGDDDDDQDGDGAPIGDGPSDDCDDEDAERFPEAVDVPGDGIDQDCDGLDAPIIPDSDRPLDTDLIDTGILDVPGEACGCATTTSPTWSLAALVAAFAGWRRARRSGTPR